jgi:hypothetical protein
MISIQAIREFALSFPETDEHPHFERQAFRVKKKIFATLLEKDQRLNVKLTPVDQSVFCAFDPLVIYPVPGKWGQNGMTTIELTRVKKGMAKDALTCAYCCVAPKELAKKYLR